MSIDADDSVNDLVGSPVVREAKKRFKRAQSWENRARSNFLNDLKFAEADSDNGWQWPNDLRRSRNLDERPTLTINKTRQFCLQIINDAKQNKPGITFRPTGNGATYESSQVLEGIARHIEYISNAQVAYDTATEFQVKAGIGYWRIATDYASEDSFDQDIYVRRIPDPLCVLMDPDCKEFDKSDMLYCFIFEDIEKDEFHRRYPQYKGRETMGALGFDDDWITRDHVRIAEYFRKVESKDKLAHVVHPETGQTMTVLKSKLKDQKLKAIIDDPSTTFREVEMNKVEWFLIIGEEVVEEKTWPGKYIPIVPLIGEETKIDGEMDRKGHTRALKDPQRMYNYWNSSATENVALQSKTPYIAPAEAIEGYETYWESANKVNHAILPYNGVDDEGNTIAPPQRQQPVTMPQAYLDGMKVAANDMMMVSGQYQSSMGEQGNERSAKAIALRDRQGDNSTYHFINNLGIAIRLTGKMVLDLIPKIYDSKRIMRIMAEDGTDMEVEINPQARQAYQQELNHQQEAVKHIFNPNVGRYEVEADMGPAYGTKRQQTFDAFTTIISQAPQLVTLIGDIMLQAADFPMADEAARRLKRMVPPQALGQGPTQHEQQLMQQVQQMQGAIGKLTFENQKNQVELKGKDQMRDIDAYEAETKRLKVMADIQAMGHEQLMALAAQLEGDAESTSLSGIGMANATPAPSPAPQLPPNAASPGLPLGVRLGAGGTEYMKNYAGNPNYIPVGVK